MGNVAIPLSGGGNKVKQIKVTCNQTFSGSGITTQRSSYNFTITFNKDGTCTISPQSTRKTYRAFDQNINIDDGFGVTILE